MKKTYSPIRVSEVERSGDNVSFRIENRQDFSNLNRLNIKWKIGDNNGLVSADIKPHNEGSVEIRSPRSISLNETLVIEFVDPRGFMIDTFSLPIGTNIRRYDVPESGTSSIVGQNEDNNHITISVNDKPYKISKKTGLLECDEFIGPFLMVLPMNNGGDTQMHGPTKYYEPYNPLCSDWKLDSIENLFNGVMLIRVHGTYKEAKGSFTYKFLAGEGIDISYNFELKEDVSPRQMGLVFDLPKEYENLSWKRKGYWSTYPDWHIARLEGKAKASEGIESCPVGPRLKPEHEWRHDRTSIGSNDFASTKHNIYSASLTDDSGNGFETRSNGKLHSRSWIDGENIKWLIASYSNGGSERFLRPHADKDDIYLKVGDTVEGTVEIEVKD
jgi:hypothetical protein